MSQIFKHPILSYYPDLSRNALKTPFDFINVFLAFRWWIFGSTFLVSVLLISMFIQGFLATPDKAFMKMYFASQARILMSLNPRSDLISEDSMNYVGVNIVGVDNITLAQELLQSPRVLDPIIEQFDLANRFGFPKEKKIILRTAFLSLVRIDADTRMKRDPIVTIEFSDTDPKMAKDITDALLRGLQNSLVQIDQLRYRNSLVSMQIQVEEIAQQMSGIQSTMLDLQKKIDSRIAGNTQADDLSKYISENESLKRKYDSLEQLYKTLSERYEFSRLKSSSTAMTPFYVIAYPEIPEKRTIKRKIIKIFVVIFGVFIFSSASSFAFHLVKNIYLPHLKKSIKLKKHS